LAFISDLILTITKNDNIRLSKKEEYWWLDEPIGETQAK
jgi:hypothetical protein